MATVIKDIVTWLTQWFYTEAEVDTITGSLQTQINNKADTSTVNTLSTTVGNKADKSNGASQITDNNANNYTNIGSLSSGASQQAINNAINTKIGMLIDVDIYEIVQTLPTASSETINKIYVVPNSSGGDDNNYDEYITVYDLNSQGTPTNFRWEKVGEISGSGLSVDWSDISNKPTEFTPASHSHNQITNDGKITSTAVTVASSDNIVITDYSDSSKIKRVANLLASHIKDSTAHTNIGSSANATQSTINTNIDTALGNKANSSDLTAKSDKTTTLGTTITLVDKGETNEGCIIFNTIS